MPAPARQHTKPALRLGSKRSYATSGVPSKDFIRRVAEK